MTATLVQIRSDASTININPGEELSSVYHTYTVTPGIDLDAIIN